MSVENEWGRSTLLGPEHDGKLSFTVPETAKIFRTSRWAGYENAKKGRWPTIKVGKKGLRIPRRFIELMLRGQAGGATA
jgi:hypothetical protein